jgi:hypothetical protein
MTDFNVFENQAQFITVRIQTEELDGSIGSGTGFLFRFKSIDDSESYFVMITNRHVVEGAKRVHFRLTRQDTSGKPDYRSHHECFFDVASYQYCAFHPESDVDLCMIALGPAITAVSNTGNPPYLKAFTAEHILTEQQRLERKGVENILMVGYPNGLSDRIHNVPLIRKGITASPIYLAHEDRPEFVVDASCFPGSSGSPVVLYDHGCFIKDGAAKFGTEVYLAGILYAGPYVQPDGSIQTRHIPTSAVTPDDIRIMINLGFCIRAEKILDFDRTLQSWGARLI